MRIGIISMQRLINFGSWLQAYGLKSLLEEQGHEVEFIDVKLTDGTVMNANKTTDNAGCFKHIARRFIRGKIYCYQLERQKRFTNDYFGVLGLSEKPNFNTNYDAVVIGSDEVFSYCQFTQWGGTILFFGQGVEAKKIISYAASFGYTTVQDLEEIHMADKIGQYLMNFSAISVRDHHSYEVVKCLCGVEAYQHLDPVLMYDFNPDVPEIHDKDYILIYGYDNRLVEAEYVQSIKAFAKKYRKKLYAVGFFQDWCDKQILASPLEVLAWVKNADYVVCETFHGTVFSIKYQKQFATIVRDSNRNKLGDLLNRFSLADRMFDGKVSLEGILTKEYDRKAAQQIIEFERKRTKEYLHDALMN